MCKSCRRGPATGRIRQVREPERHGCHCPMTAMAGRSRNIGIEPARSHSISLSESCSKNLGISYINSTEKYYSCIKRLCKSARTDTPARFNEFSSRADNCVVQELSSAPLALLHLVWLASTLMAAAECWLVYAHRALQEATAPHQASVSFR